MPNAHHRPSQELLVRLGVNVRRERQRAGYTQEQLAELVDVHPRMIQKIEAGETNILATTAMRIQAALEADWMALMPPVEIEQALKRRFARAKPGAGQKRMGESKNAER